MVIILHPFLLLTKLMSQARADGLLATWEDRIERARMLAEKYDFAREPLTFYGELLLFQKELYDSLSALEDDYCPFEAGSLGAHLSVLIKSFPKFLSLVERIGTEQLSSLAKQLGGSGRWADLLESYWAKRLEESSEDPALGFFPKAFLQPYAELMAGRHALSEEWPVEQGGLALCPLCGRQPQLSLLRSEAEGARRSLLCSLCATEWRYKRICCPSCGEESFEKLSYHKTEEFPHVRLDTCDACSTYIKSIDLTVDGRAIPTVDEIAALPLDLWAIEQGYKKIELNLVGV
jgi:FdhE protein